MIQVVDFHEEILQFAEKKKLEIIYIKEQGLQNKTIIIKPIYPTYKTMKINIITLHKVFNYGSVLQTYALFKKLEHMGFNVEIIDYLPKRMKMINRLTGSNRYNKAYKLLLITPNRLSTIFNTLSNHFTFNTFLKQNINLTEKQYLSFKELKADLPEADIYITGSDQVWNSFHNRGIDASFFLDFAPENKKRLAYAASFGKETLERNEISITKELISKYHAISVRESSGLDVLESVSRHDGVHVLDPTLLLAPKDWSKIQRKKEYKEKYLLIYTVDYDEDILLKEAKKIAQKKQLKIYLLTTRWHISRLKNFRLYDKVFIFISPGIFLNLFANANFIVARSFHGTVFSIIYNKPFISFCAKYYNSRIKNLLDLFNLSNRMVSSKIDDNIIDESINYPQVNQRLNYERKKSLSFLKKAILD